MRGGVGTDSSTTTVSSTTTGCGGTGVTSASCSTACFGSSLQDDAVKIHEKKHFMSPRREASAFWGRMRVARRRTERKPSLNLFGEKDMLMGRLYHFPTSRV